MKTFQMIAKVNSLVLTVKPRKPIIKKFIKKSKAKTGISGNEQ